MKLRLATLVFLAALPLAAQSPALPQNVELVDRYGGIEQYRLRSNGMPIYLVPDHTAPVATFMVVYHVGSRNEAPGNTGSAHLLEHMIFNKSTANFGKANGHKTFQEVLYEAGADFSSTNMTTWNDRMNGYSTLPSNKLELAMKIEADRLGRALILDSERQSEMSVVRNEYEIGNNDPYNALQNAVIGAAIVAHPYHWDTIGYRSDIEGVTTDKLREHYQNFFHADNAEAILVGDFDRAAALAMFDHEFGAFERAKKPIPQVITVEPPQEGERRVVVKRPGNLRIVELAYMRPGALDPDFVTLDVLAEILGDGISSRLQQGLVETGLATSFGFGNNTFRDPYPILFSATVSEKSDPQKVEDALKRILYDVAAKGVSTEEVARAQQQLEVAVARTRDGAYQYASALGEAVASANWKWFVDYIPTVRRVTPADVQRVAAKYLVPDHATVGWFVPATEVASKESPNTPVKAASVAPSSPNPQPLQSSAPVASSTASSPVSTSFAARTLHRVLPNGLTVDILESHTVPTVAIQGIILGGDSSAPAGKPAVPMMTASMVQRGTATRTKQQIADLLDPKGATLGIATNLYETTITGRGMSRETPLLLEILAEELRAPAFSAEEMEKARAEMKNDVLQRAEDTSGRAINQLTQLVFPKDYPYRSPGHQALAASVDAATIADLKDFQSRRYVGSSMVLAIVGDVDAKKTMELVTRLFGSMPRGSRPELSTEHVAPTAAQKVVVSMPGKSNMNLVLGESSGLRRNDPDFEAALIANAALGQNSLSSRIGKRVRDTEGLSYNLYSRFLMTDLMEGMFLVNVNVAPVNLQKAYHSTIDEVRKFARDGATDDEIAIGKSFFAGNYRVGLGSNTGIATALVTAEKFGYGPRYLDEFPSRVERVTKADVNRVIKERLRPDQLHVVVAGDLVELKLED